jgi:hypothetical protein
MRKVSRQKVKEAEGETGHISVLHPEKWDASFPFFPPSALYLLPSAFCLLPSKNHKNKSAMHKT